MVIRAGAEPSITMAPATWVRSACAYPIIKHASLLSTTMAESLRGLPKPVIGRIHKGALLLDLRCLDDEAGFVAHLELLVL